MICRSLAITTSAIAAEGLTTLTAVVSSGHHGLVAPRWCRDGALGVVTGHAAREAYGWLESSSVT